MLPVYLFNILLRCKGASEKRIRNRNSNLIIKCSTLNEGEIHNLLSLNKYGSKFDEYINMYINVSISPISIKNNLLSSERPIVICIVKDDLIRMKLFLTHYRKMGIDSFFILDDSSTDGTREYLLDQSDVTVFESNVQYSTIIRQVWVNKMISYIGKNRWFLIVDSDELFDFSEEYSNSIMDYVKDLEAKEVSRAKALLLDMFCEKGLYADVIEKPEDIEKEYKYFYPYYYLEPTHYDVSVKGGARQIFFNESGKMPIASKYPLIYIDSEDILFNSHVYFPFKRNVPNRPSTVLKHYKFLPGDQEKYIERIKKKNFEGNSQEYKAYYSYNSDFGFELINKMVEYKTFSSTNIITIMER